MTKSKNVISSGFSSYCMSLNDNSENTISENDYSFFFIWKGLSEFYILFPRTNFTRLLFIYILGVYFLDKLL